MGRSASLVRNAAPSVTPLWAGLHALLLVVRLYYHDKDPS